MSTRFVVKVPAGLPLSPSLLEPADGDIVWVPAEIGDPLPPGDWGIYRDRVSTRKTRVQYEPPHLTVTISAGACREDCDLALDLVRAAARFAGTGEGAEIEAEGPGMISSQQLDVLFDDGWKRSQLESTVRTTVALFEMRGTIALPGPVRDTYVGPNVVAELAADQPGAADRLVAVMRRVQWPDPSYHVATRFQATSPAGDKTTLAILLPESPCVLPGTDQLALEDDDGIVLIPRARLADLPVEIDYLDDQNQLIAPISRSRWPGVCATARTFALPRDS